MAFCSQCGAQINDDARFCPACGAQQAPAQNGAQNEPGGGQTQDGYQAYTDPSQSQQQNTQQSAYGQNYGQQQQYGYGQQNPYQQAPMSPEQDAQQNKGIAWLAYLGILFFIPMVAKSDSKFCRFHSNQGLVLLIFDFIVWIAAAILTAIFIGISWRLYWIASIFSAAAGITILVFVILGIVNAANGKYKELPLIGKIKLIK